jgi:light-regulated signal transduction histidine kinase (bacteriophytochrome)
LFNRVPQKGDQIADYFPANSFHQFKKYTEEVFNGININYEINHAQPDGTLHWYNVRLFPITNIQNEIFGVLVAMSDVAGHKNSESRLEELNETLKQHAKDLAISNAELEQFAYVASHDLQEPLRMITSFMAQLEKKYGHLVDDKGKQYIHFAIDGAKRMRQIILDLLDFSRVGRTEDDQEEVDVNSIVNETLALNRKSLEETGAKVLFENLPVIRTYRVPFRQVFQNLVGNAIKYHADQAPVINISCKETKTQYQFAVKDNGIGMAPEYFDKIFIIFQRLHNKDEYSGTGMGLAIAKKIVENLGGKIWVESAVGMGSTFYFTIPRNNKKIKK